MVERLPFAVGLLLTLITAATNIGFIALDDYVYNVSVVVPAQNFSVHSIIPLVDFRSPVPSLVLHSIAQVAFQLGMSQPTLQFRFVLMILGLFSFSTVFFTTMAITSGRTRQVAAWLLATFFLMPLLLSRPMYESLTIPYLFLSLYFACRYDQKGAMTHLVAAVFFVAVASMFRFQVGLCGIALFALVLWKRHLSHVIVLVTSGSVFFLLAGLPDWILKGEWHASLKGYVAFNLAHSSTFGVTPFYTYFLLFLGLSLPLVLFSRFRGLPWKIEYRPLLPALAYFAFFFVVHSAVPHKEERFMIPMVPLFVVLVAPLVSYLWEERWRRYLGLALNFLLLPVICLSEPQRNVISFVKYLDEHPELQTIISVDDTLVLFPEAFLRKVPKIVLAPSLDLSPFLRGADCETGVIVRRDIVARTGMALGKWKKISDFEPALFEGWFVKLNPKHNARRGPLELYRAAHCGG